MGVGVGGLWTALKTIYIAKNPLVLYLSPNVMMDLIINKKGNVDLIMSRGNMILYPFERSVPPLPVFTCFLITYFKYNYLLKASFSIHTCINKTLSSRAPSTLTFKKKCFI